MTEHSKVFFIVVSLVMVFSGTLSTIASKWSDSLHAKGRNGKVSQFDHPFVQTWLMFLGEFTCQIYQQAMVAWTKYKKEPLIEGVHTRKPVTPLIFLLTACCDFTATTTMYVGLTMTHASVFQMLRGAVVVFTGLFSILFLRRRFRLYQWTGMCLATVGLALVGLSSVLYNKNKDGASNPLLGDVLVVAAQLIVAGQMVLEEKFMTKYNVPPFSVVGWEGTFGLLITTTALGIFQAFSNPPDDFVDALIQMRDPRIGLSNFLAFLSFPLLNASGQIITKNVSAAARMVLDTVRNVVVWVFTMAYVSYFHEEFQWLQAVGFIVMIFGNSMFKYILRMPCELCRDPVIDAERAEQQALIESGHEDEAHDPLPHSPGINKK